MSKEPPRPRTGAPSAWSSDEPVVAPPVMHSHPLPPSVRVLLIVYGLALGCALGGTGWLVYSGQQADAHDRKALATHVEQDIAKAQAAGKERDRVAAEKMRHTVCIVIKESLRPTPATRALAHQLKCDVPTPSPTPQPAPVPRASGSAAGRSTPPGVSPTARPSARPTGRPPSPHPSPSPTCTAYNPVNGKCLLIASGRR